MSKNFEQTWLEELAAGVPGVRLADVAHPLDIFTGASDLSQPRLQIRASQKPSLPRLSELVVVDLGEHRDSWLLTLTLQDQQFKEVFISLSSHLITRSRSAPDEASALRAVDESLDQWSRLLRPRPLGRLSLEALRGLVGELWFLTNEPMQRVGPVKALDGWQGPMGSHQDFWYPDTGFTEVKAIGASATRILINSAEQLDAAPLQLAVLTVPQVAETDPGAVNLPQLVLRLEDSLTSDPGHLKQLDLRLNRLGVDLEDSYYGDVWFKVTEVSKYDVTEDFPAIRAKDTSPAVSDVTYTISKAALEPFKSTTLFGS